MRLNRRNTNSWWFLFYLLRLGADHGLYRGVPRLPLFAMAFLARWHLFLLCWLLRLPHSQHLLSLQLLQDFIHVLTFIIPNQMLGSIFEILRRQWQIQLLFRKLPQFGLILILVPIATLCVFLLKNSPIFFISFILSLYAVLAHIVEWHVLVLIWSDATELADWLVVIGVCTVLSGGQVAVELDWFWLAVARHILYKNYILN